MSPGQGRWGAICNSPAYVSGVAGHHVLTPPGSAPVPLVEVDHVRGLAPAMGPNQIDGTAVRTTVLPTSPQDTSGRSGRRRLGLLRAVATGAVVVLVVHERNLIVLSFRAIGHLDWVWLVLAVMLGSASMASFAYLQCRLLRAGTARVGLRPVLATVYAGNAVAATVPFAGSQMSVVFVFRRFKQMGVEATVAGWTWIAGGLISSLAAALLLVVGAVLTGNDFVAVTGASAGIVGIGGLAMATTAIRRPAVLTALERPAGWTFQKTCRVLGRPVRDPHEVFRSLADRLGSLRLPPSGWATVVAVAFVNWLADIGVLAASIAAVGGRVPWRGLLFAYGVGTAAGSVGVIPGGLGVVEAALALSLMGAGVRHPLALAAVLVYRLASFWMVIFVGWLTYLFGARPRTATRGMDRRSGGVPPSGGEP